MFVFTDEKYHAKFMELSKSAMRVISFMSIPNAKHYVTSKEGIMESPELHNE